MMKDEDYDKADIILTELPLISYLSSHVMLWISYPRQTRKSLSITVFSEEVKVSTARTQEFVDVNRFEEFLWLWNF